MIAPSSPQPNSGPLMTKMLKTEVGLCWESWPGDLGDAAGYPLLHTTYWVARILTDLNVHNVDAQVLYNSAANIISLLISTPDFVSPITHYSFALAVVVLIELRNDARIKDTVAETLREPINKNHAQTSWDHAIHTKIFDVFNNPAPDTLQQLAEAASGIAGVNSGNGGEGGTSASAGGGSTAASSVGEFTKLQETIKKGYLSIFQS